MALMPGAEWIGPTVNKYAGGQTDVHGLVLHIQQGTESGSESWFKDPAAQASAHFLNPKTGGLKQLVDTDDASWAEMAGNRHWISIENEGLSGESLTPSQVVNAGRLLAWLHTSKSVPLVSTDDPNGQGLGWHGMGGSAWGGHFDCPGDPIKAQRDLIIAEARSLLPGASQTPPPAQHAPWPGRYLRNDPGQAMMSGTDIKVWQQRMHDRGWPIAVDGWYGHQSDHVCRGFQADCTAHGWPLTVDGIVGPATWNAAFERPVS